MASHHLPLFTELPSPRDALISRWLLLTHQVLPDMARQHDFPISRNHCFMRVCLDASLGAPWHKSVKRPALRHMTDGQLAQAVAMAERIVEAPSLIFELNRRSIEQRRASQGQP
jgi:hypothetical protein